MDDTTYFAPSYFSPSYFAPLGVIELAPGAPDAPPECSDRSAYDAIVRLLADSGEFVWVRFGETPEDLTLAFGDAPIAIITSEGWLEDDDEIAPLTLRRVQFTLSVFVRDSNSVDRFSQVDRLSSVVQDLLTDSSLNGSCLPPFSKIRKAAFDRRYRAPELCARLEGEFAYLIDPISGRHASS